MFDQFGGMNKVTVLEKIGGYGNAPQLPLSLSAVWWKLKLTPNSQVD